jgi:hypothetical protein
MTIYTINTGSSANKGDGDSLRTAFHKINLNFAYLSTQTGGGGGGTADTGAITFSNNVISTTATNQEIIFDPNGSGRVRFRNTAIQFDNGTGGNTGAGSHILYTRGADKVVGLGIDGTNSSLRIVGDKDTLGTLLDMGLYNGALGAWSSKVLVNYQGNITAAGEVITSGGVRFSDGSLQTSAGGGLTLSEITTGTVSNQIVGVQTIRFDTNSGFELTDLGNNAVQVGMNSTFKYWEVNGQPTLIAEGLDTVQFIAGTGMTISTDNTANTKWIRFEALEGGGLGNFVIDDSQISSTNPDQPVVFKNFNTTTGATNYLSLPSNNDSIGDVTLESKNGVLITTNESSNAPITIAPNGDGLGGQGFIVISAAGTTGTAGVFLQSASAQINMWPYQALSQLNNGPDAGGLDIITLNNTNVSVRPNGTGTFVVTGNIQNRKNLLLSTESYNAGGNVNSSTYQAGALELDINKQVQSLISGDYYLPPGLEGQIAYFAPQDTAQGNSSTRIWFQKVRIMLSGTGIELYNQEWYPFKPNSSQAQGVVYAIYINGAWTPSHSYIS